MGSRRKYSWSEKWVNSFADFARIMTLLNAAFASAALTTRRFNNALETAFYGKCFHTWETFGFDAGILQFRARWFVNHGWPRVEKDRQCWFLFAGPFEVSSHRGKFL